MILCISVLSVVISPFSFLILLISFFSVLANGLSILFIFSRNQLLALLIFAMVSFVSFAFISALILRSFLLLIQPVHPKGDQYWVFIGGTDIEAETPILWPPDAESGLILKDPDDVKD